tara:strand:+ start:5498 stop:5899 length:402 start_codon:yes stop_codon:yes gene_type:complete
VAQLALDHITIHCRDLEVSRRFYATVLDLESGYRPPFDGPPGAWLYDDQERPVIHLYAGRDADDAPNSALDHIAFAVNDLVSVKERLADRGIAFETATVPELDAEQVFLSDPDGIGLEISNASAADLIRNWAT